MKNLLKKLLNYAPIRGILKGFLLGPLVEFIKNKTDNGKHKSIVWQLVGLTLLLLGAAYGIIPVESFLAFVRVLFGLG